MWTPLFGPPQRGRPIPMFRSCNRPPLQRWFSAPPSPAPPPAVWAPSAKPGPCPRGEGTRVGGRGTTAEAVACYTAPARGVPVCTAPARGVPVCTAPARGVPVCTAPARGVATRRLPGVLLHGACPGCFRLHGACPGCFRLHGACAGCLPSARRLAGVFRVCRSVHPCARLPTRAGGDGTTNSLRLTKTLTHPERPRNLPDACGILILEIAPAVPSRPARAPDEENRQWTIPKPRHGGGFLLPGRSYIRASWQCSAWRRRSSWQSLACASSPLERTSLNASTIPTWDGRACRTWIAS